MKLTNSVPSFLKLFYCKYLSVLSVYVSVPCSCLPSAHEATVCARDRIQVLWKKSQGFLTAEPSLHPQDVPVFQYRTKDKEPGCSSFF